VHFLRAYFVRDGWQLQTLAFAFGVGDEFYRARHDRLDGGRRSRRQCAVHGWVDVQQLVAGFQESCQAELQFAHGLKNLLAFHQAIFLMPS